MVSQSQLVVVAITPSAAHHLAIHPSLVLSARFLDCMLRTVVDMQCLLCMQQLGAQLVLHLLHGTGACAAHSWRRALDWREHLMLRVQPHLLGIILSLAMRHTLRSLHRPKRVPRKGSLPLGAPCQEVLLMPP